MNIRSLWKLPNGKDWLWGKLCFALMGKAMLSSVQSFSHVWVFATPWTTARQASCPSPTPGVHPHSCPLSQWCHPTISSVVPFSSCPQSFPASGFFKWVSSSHQVVKVLEFQLQHHPSNEYSGPISLRIDWLELLESKGPWRVLCNTTVQKHQFFSVQPSLWSNYHINTWLLEKS